MKKHLNKRGFALILLIFFIAVIGIETVILTGISSTVAFETDHAYLNACRDNLVISGLAWARENAGRVTTNETAELDVTSLGMRRVESSLSVSVGSKEANIKVTCSAARQNLSMDKKYGF